MIRRAHAQRSLVEVLLPDGEKLWDPVLRRIDAAELGDEGLVDRGDLTGEEARAAARQVLSENAVALYGLAASC